MLIDEELLSLDYYNKCIKYFYDYFNGDCCFIFFSPDIEWCKEVFGRKEMFIYQDFTKMIDRDIIEFYLMSYL